MNENSPSNEPPSVQQAANDLREAAGQRAKEVAQSAEQNAQQLKETAAAKAQQFREFAEEKAHTLKENAGERAQQFRDVAGEQWGETRVKARAAYDDTEDYIRTHPGKSILIAGGVGFLLGLIVRR